MEKVSLIIPLKDEEKSVQALIDSISVQTVLPDEVIFVDAGSEDKTRAIIEDNLSKLKFNARLISAGRAYPGEARNIGIKERVSDLFTKTDNPFIVLFDVEHRDISGKVLFINKNNIVWVEPEDQ